MLNTNKMLKLMKNIKVRCLRNGEMDVVRIVIILIILCEEEVR
jgi:hypothetical protein